MKPVILYAALVFMVLPVGYAQSSTFRETKDCPLAKPFDVEPSFQSAADTQIRSYPMQGYKIRRIQIFSPQKADLEIIWVPTEMSWGERAAKITVEAKRPQCFWAESFPYNTPAKQIQVRSQKKIEGLKVLFSDIPWDHQEECVAQELCPLLLDAMNNCQTDPDERVCHHFIENLRRLTEKKQCRREFDTDPVPAIWLCDKETKQNDILGRVLRLLKSLKFERAINYYQSSEFKNILDGSYAEEYNGL